uniref:ADAMTS-like protein 1 isoform X1 n=1 Tax=Petromyzon marinus TaxID=7757 RepID=A0AAJ7SRQ0_PETMA|nr:ADAMTS-like protein 1 isoform X1 [Petromyzon marinus]
MDGLIPLLCLFTFATPQVCGEQGRSAVFLPEFSLSRKEPLVDESVGEPLLTYRNGGEQIHPTSEEEERNSAWDAWGAWSECSRTCGGGASYSLRRCLDKGNCEGRNIRYKSCSNNDCPAESGDFRAQQCSAHNDVRYQGRSHEWVAAGGDPGRPCALTCAARGSPLLIVELAPKVLDGTRCRPGSLDMCISGVCQHVGCDHQLGSQAKDDNCGVCGGNGTTCRLVRGQTRPQLSSSDKPEETIITMPYGSRHVKITNKGPNHLFVESKTLQGVRNTHWLDWSGTALLANSTAEFSLLHDKEVLKMSGPLTADFTIKSRFVGPGESLVQFFFYQPLSHQWRETDFFPCSVTCGGGYQLTSAECVDVRLGRVVADQYCHYYPENKKPKPILRECNMEPCPASDGYKQIMSYDHFQPIPRWDGGPWTTCSSSCGGGLQSRTVACVEEDLHSILHPAEDWKCMYTLRPVASQPCNLFDCPRWLAQEWSSCTATCGRGLRYRVVLCMDYRGHHAGGCNPKIKPHIKEECIVPVPCYKIKEKLPVEAKLPWLKQAQGLQEEAETEVSEEPMFIAGPWSPCSATCGVGVRTRAVACRVFLSFSRTVADLPDEECGEGPRPSTTRACRAASCSADFAPAGWREEGEDEESEEEGEGEQDGEEEGESERGDDGERDVTPHAIEPVFEWEYQGFTDCSESCGGGTQEARAVCLSKEGGEPADHALCNASHRPPRLLKSCNADPCPPRWEEGEWSPCPVSCGQGLHTREVVCARRVASPPAGRSRERPPPPPPPPLLLPDRECALPKPPAARPCARLDCPPAWHAQPWQQCSRTCGRGSQTRAVLCQQRRADGTFLALPKALCRESPPPAHRQPCAQIDCAPRWATRPWQQCSRSCEVGNQWRAVSCQTLSGAGETLTVDPAVCQSLPKPLSTKVCSLRPCTHGKGKQSNRKSTRKEPQIAAMHKVYIQSRWDRRLHFDVGGRAYLHPKTTVVVRCPVRHFDKALIRWERDGLPLANSSRIVLGRSGALKVRHLETSDIGVYTCVAGSARENFAVKLIGVVGGGGVGSSQGSRVAKQKSEPPVLSGAEELKHNEAASSASKEMDVQKLRKQITANKYEFYRDDGSLYDRIVLRVLEKKLEAKTKPASTESSDSADKDYSYDDIINLDASNPVAYITEEDKLEGLIRNITLRLRGQHQIGTSTQPARDLIAKSPTQTLSPRAAGVFEQGKWEGNNSVASTAVPTQNPRGLSAEPEATTEEPGDFLHTAQVNDGYRASPRFTSAPYEVPAIEREDLPLSLLSHKDIRVQVGHPLLLSHRPEALTLSCNAHGVPSPVITWLQDDTPVAFGNRVSEQTDGCLRIEQPVESDSGLYTCLATNRAGTDTLSSLVTITADSLIKTTREVITDLSARLVEVNVGGMVRVRAGTNVTLGCHMDRPSTVETAWTKGGGDLERSLPSLANGSLILVNVTAADEGVYTCTTSSPFGSVLESTTLIVLEPPRFHHHFVEVAALLSGTTEREHAGMVSLRGDTSLNVPTGHDLIVGCPVAGNTKPNMTWYLGSQPVQSLPGLSYQLLAGEKVLRLRGVVGPWDGPVRCVAQNEAGTLTATLHIAVGELSWTPGEPSPCSASCGNTGVQSWRLRCVRDDLEEVDASLCQGLPKPSLAAPQRCNRRDCPPSWSVEEWGTCSRSCGGGMRLRHVTCQMLSSDGEVTPLPVGLCEHDAGPRPTEEESCAATHDCPHWVALDWGQCTGRCVGWMTGTKHRRVSCRTTNGTLVPDSACDKSSRPALSQNCSAEACAGEWRPGRWSECTATCGSHGFQSRRLECAGAAADAAGGEHSCAWQPKPITWQRCNIIPCEKGECKDTTRYCHLVKRLKLCQLMMYKLRCCESCKDL